jgi:hypothetical protein
MRKVFYDVNRVLFLMHLKSMQRHAFITIAMFTKHYFKIHNVNCKINNIYVYSRWHYITSACYEKNALYTLKSKWRNIHFGVCRLIRALHPNIHSFIHIEVIYWNALRFFFFFFFFFFCPSSLLWCHVLDHLSSRTKQSMGNKNWVEKLDEREKFFWGRKLLTGAKVKKVYERAAVVLLVNEHAPCLASRICFTVRKRRRFFFCSFLTLYIIYFLTYILVSRVVSFYAGIIKII